MGGFEIHTVRAREILDCRLEPTLRVTVETANGTGEADVPAGRSVGSNEAVDLRDGGDRYHGKGVQTACANVESTIAPAVTGLDVRDQREIDHQLRELDGTANKSVLGGNATTGVSLATLDAAATTRGQDLYQYIDAIASSRLPVPVLDMIEGGELAATDLAFQEHQLIPVNAESFSEAIRMGAEIYYELGDQLATNWGRQARNVGVEGGYTPPSMTDPRDAFDALLSAAETCGYREKIALGIDAAATHFYQPDTETYRLMDEEYSSEDLIVYYEDLTDEYPLISIEDPLHEADFAGTATLTEAVDAQIIGDDLFTTNPTRITTGIDAGAANALLLKINQIGTVTEAFQAAETAREAGFAIQVSERSGQTPDTWLADVAVGLGAGQIKTGVTRGERTEQYNRLLEIESQLDTTADFAWTG